MRSLSYHLLSYLLSCAVFQLILKYWILLLALVCSFSVNIEISDFAPGIRVQFFNLNRISVFEAQNPCASFQLKQKFCN